MSGLHLFCSIETVGKSLVANQMLVTEEAEAQRGKLTERRNVWFPTVPRLVEKWRKFRFLV